MRYLAGISLASLLLAAAPAAAALPDINVDRVCSQIVLQMGKDGGMMRPCVAQEHEARLALAAYWDGLPADLQKQCSEMTQSRAGGYFLLGACVDQMRAGGKPAGGVPQP